MRRKLSNEKSNFFYVKCKSPECPKPTNRTHGLCKRHYAIQMARLANGLVRNLYDKLGRIMKGRNFV
jgi:hypothetical protein